VTDNLTTKKQRNEEFIFGISRVGGKFISPSSRPSPPGEGEKFVTTATNVAQLRQYRICVFILEHSTPTSDTQK
jgi:hypothetical protein